MRRHIDFRNFEFFSLFLHFLFLWLHNSVINANVINQAGEVGSCFHKVAGTNVQAHETLDKKCQTACADAGYADEGVRAEASILSSCFNIARMISIVGVTGLIAKLGS